MNPERAAHNPSGQEPTGQGSNGASAQPATAFEWVGGEAKVRALVDRFYDLMDLEPAYLGIRALHPPDMAESRNKLFWFLCGWLGGPAHYVERFGHPRLRARHLPYAIGLAERDQWMACMLQALREEGHPEALVERLLQSLFNTADWMRNKGG
ncbi:MAG: group II truncated hemoglobin [Betaproteobacteria bacterium]|nr:group II truncated hemoglobin [Betaproteobacteria bacterium]